MNKKCLPDSLKKYFWDCDFKSLNIEDYPDFITARILNYGNEESVEWVVSHIKKDKLIKIMGTSKNSSPLVTSKVKTHFYH